MTGAGSLLERVRAKVGWEGPERSSTVEAGHVRRFCEAVGEDPARWTEAVPPTFLVTLWTETPQIPEVLEYGRGWLNGGDRFSYLEPVRVGDIILSKTVLRDAYEKRGSTGALLFLEFETEYRRPGGAVVARLLGTRIRR